MSSKLRRVTESNHTFNKTFNSPTIKNLKESIDSQSSSNMALKSSVETLSKKKPPSTKKNVPNLNLNNEKPTTPKELLSYLLKNSLGKSLLKMESRTKEQMNNLKLVYKYFVVFDKNIDLLKKGVERKKKEDEKKLKLMQAKKSKTTATPKVRSKTVQNLRRPERENSVMSLKKNKINNDIGNKTLVRNKTERYNLDEYSKRSKTVKKLPSHYPLKTKSSKDNTNASRTMTENTPKAGKIINYKMQSSFRDKVIPPNVITNPKGDNEDQDKTNENTKYNTINTNSNSRSKNRKKSIKGIERGLERKKSIKGAERGLVRRKSLKAIKTERTLERRKSIKALKLEKAEKAEEKDGKKLNKKKLKIDGDNKPRKSIRNNNNLNEQNSQTPIIKEIEKNISNFIFNDINIINNNINTSINNSLKDSNDNTNENININKIIDDKKGADNKKGHSEFKNVIKELEELNDKKPKLEEEKDEGQIIRERIRSRSKNREKKSPDTISIDKDIEGLNDVKHMVEGVSGVLNKINNDKKIRFDKKKNNNDSFISKDMNDEENKNSINKESEDKKSNKINNKEIQNNKLLNEIDREMTKLIESEEKRQKLEKEQEKANSKRNSININNSIVNSGISEIKSNENENKKIIKNYKEDIMTNDYNDSYNKKEDKIQFIKKDDSLNNNNNITNTNKVEINSSLIKNIKNEKENQIMNQEIIDSIKKE